MTTATYQVATLSNSTNFQPINISAITSVSPTLIHTADSVNYDEIWLNAYNYGSTDNILTILFGGNAAYQLMSLVVPANRGLIPVINGLRFTGSVVISGYASVTNTISVIGSVNRIVFV
jgi:hypothetical protein